MTWEIMQTNTNIIQNTENEQIVFKAAESDKSQRPFDHRTNLIRRWDTAPARPQLPTSMCCSHPGALTNAEAASGDTQGVVQWTDPTSESFCSTSSPALLLSGHKRVLLCSPPLCPQPSCFSAWGVMAMKPVSGVTSAVSHSWHSRLYRDPHAQRKGATSDLSMYDVCFLYVLLRVHVNGRSVDRKQRRCSLSVASGSNQWEASLCCCSTVWPMSKLKTWAPTPVRPSRGFSSRYRQELVFFMSTKKIKLKFELLIGLTLAWL